MTKLEQKVNKYTSTTIDNLSKNINTIADNYYQVGTHVALGYFKMMIDNGWDKEEMLEYINKTIKDSSDELKLIYLEASIYSFNKEE